MYYAWETNRTRIPKRNVAFILLVSFADDGR